MENRQALGLYAATWLGWLALLASMVPGMGDYFGYELRGLGIAIGPTGSIVLALHKIVVPVAQVFQAGKDAGRREVESVPEGRHLRVVERD